MSEIDIPNADKLDIVISPDGKWAVFDFAIGEKRARLTMATHTLPETINAFMDALNSDSLAGISVRGLNSGYYSARGVPALEIGTSAIPLSEDVTVDFELPAAVQIHVRMIPNDAKRLQGAITAALQTAEDNLRSTRQ